MNGLGDPIPLGDEVSEGRLSEARDLPSFNAEGFQCNTILHAKNSPCPSPKLNPNPNRVTGNDNKNLELGTPDIYECCQGSSKLKIICPISLQGEEDVVELVALQLGRKHKISR